MGAKDVGAETAGVLKADIVIIGGDRDRFDVGRNPVHKGRQTARAARGPTAKSGRFVQRQTVLNAFGDRETKAIVYRRQHDGPADRLADHDLVAIAASL